MKKSLFPPRPLISSLLLLLAFALLQASPVFAQEDGEPAVSNDQCLLCHSEPDLTMVLPSNEVLPLTIDESELADSVHGLHIDDPLLCVDCHNDRSGYPHPQFKEPDYRSWQIEISRVCGNCHEDEALARQDSIHARLLAAGKEEAAVCVDCHGSHGVQWANPEDHEVDRMAQVNACGRCHSTVADEFKESIHGQELADGNEDVPTCSSCHPAHKIEDPRSAEFRLKSPETCGQCHADEALMAKYDISTDVFDTYVADFHGATVQIFENLQPGVYTNKAVCSDCHTAHHILPPTDENSSVMKANLTKTCQRCHPDANESFTASWMGHYRPDWQHYPLVTAVQWFYWLIIPFTLAFFAVFVSTDAFRTIKDRGKKKKAKKQAEAAPDPQQGGEDND